MALTAQVAVARPEMVRVAFVHLSTLILVVAAVSALVDGDASHGWSRYDSPLDGPCTVERVPFDEMTADRFDSEYRDNKPVVLTGMRDRNDAFRDACAKDVLLREWGDKDIVLSTADTHSYLKFTKTLREYVSSHTAPQRLDKRGDETLIWFGDNNHTEWRSHFDLCQKPPFGTSNADVAYSFGVGGPHSGVPLHVHGPGWSETIVGRKRWWLSPPKPKPRFHPNATSLEWALGLKPLQEGGEGGREVLGRREVDVGDDDGAWVHFPERYRTRMEKTRKERTRQQGGVEMLECTVGEGDAVWFPDRWWHATLNLDESAFISSFVNFRNVASGSGEDDEDVLISKMEL